MDETFFLIPMRLLFLLLSFFYQTYSQLNPTEENPPHGCDNFGLCASNPDPTVDTYSCPSGNCICQNGTTGGLCEEIIHSCEPNPCPTNGQYDCNETITGAVCTCTAGYTGSDCSISISSPCGINPCMNGGICSTSGNTTYTCSCINDYLPPNCQYQDPCKPGGATPCQNNGTCYPIWNGANFLCSCQPGYWDRTCNSSIYEWAANTQIKQGCYQYSSDLEDSSKYYKITDSQMTYSMCQSILHTTVKIPPYTMFTLMNDTCFLSTESYLNGTTNSDQCSHPCPGDSAQICGNDDGENQTNWAVIWTIDNKISNATQMCPTYSSTYCLNSTGHGMCISMPTSFSSAQYLCICQPPYVQLQSRTECGVSTACSPNPCQNEGTCSTTDGINYTCSCPSPYVGANCTITSGCTPDPCLYGSTCIANDTGGYSCNCLQWYSGPNCGDIDVCQYKNPCVNGTCHNNGTGIEIWPVCTCNPGITGTYCDQMINYCETYEPCWYNSTCTPSFMHYSCSCIPGTTDTNCSTIIDNCIPYTDPSTKMNYTTRCNTKDPDAVCVNEINNFTCNCSALWTEYYCDLNVIIENVLRDIYGTVDLTMLPLLNELLQTPAMIADMVPFIIGTLSSEQRMSMSWSYSDMFYWANFEEKELNLTRDFVQWNDVVLGNCFTFNHPNGTQWYNYRSSQYEGGLRVRLKINQDEYEPWTDTAAIVTFIHYMNDYVMSESVRYNAEPNAEVVFFPYTSVYTRLGGAYGTCINDPSEVKAFYFPGAYTTDGCLRSCYQDMIEKNCGCMDPRYPMPSDASPCIVSNMTCVDDASSVAGDPSTWPTCICPLPCSNMDFGITWSKSNFRVETANCLSSDGNTWNETCQDETADSVIVQVTVPELTFSTFAETPTMDFNQLIGSLGALLGVLMGICAITFVEILVMIFRLIPAFCCSSKK